MTTQQIGAALVAARKRLKKSPYKVCKEAGITYQQLRNMEQALTNYTIGSLQQVCNTVNLKITLS